MIESHTHKKKSQPKKKSPMDVILEMHYARVNLWAGFFFFLPPRFESFAVILYEIWDQWVYNI